MRKNLKLLGELQAIDLKIDGLAGEKDALLEEIAVLENSVIEARTVIAEKSAEAEVLETEKN